MSQARTTTCTPPQAQNGPMTRFSLRGTAAFLGRVLLYTAILTLSYWVLEAHINEAFLYEGF